MIENKAESIKNFIFEIEKLGPENSKNLGVLSIALTIINDFKNHENTEERLLKNENPLLLKAIKLLNEIKCTENKQEEIAKRIIDFLEEKTPKHAEIEIKFLEYSHADKGKTFFCNIRRKRCLETLQNTHLKVNPCIKFPRFKPIPLHNINGENRLKFIQNNMVESILSLKPSSNDLKESILPISFKRRKFPETKNLKNSTDSQFLIENTYKNPYIMVKNSDTKTSPCDDLDDDNLKPILIDNLLFLKKYLSTKNNVKWQFDNKKTEIFKKLTCLSEIITDLVFDIIN